MSALSPIDRRLLAALDLGEIKSLFLFSIEQELDYASCHKRVKRLEAAGLVAVDRQPGRPLLIRRLARALSELEVLI